MAYKRKIPTHPCLNCPHKTRQNAGICGQCHKRHIGHMFFPHDSTESHDLCEESSCKKIVDKIIIKI